MQAIQEKLIRISNVWNRYVFPLKFFQLRINFTDEVRSNYFGDIMQYFDDTLGLIRIRKSGKYQQQIFNYIGLLQVIYIQQDLTDELLYIFKLPQSLRIDKDKNRELRNELTGHPVRRNKKEGNPLKSTVFYGRHLSPEYIHYIRYSPHNNFNGESVRHSTQEIIKRHSCFLDKYLGKINAKLDSLLVDYREQLKRIEWMAAGNARFQGIVSVVDHYMESIAKDSPLFTKEILLSCYNRRNEHPRYQYVIDEFLKSLQQTLKDWLKDIDELLGGKHLPGKKAKPFIAEVSFSDQVTMLSEQQKERNYLHYELSKLYEGKHPLFSFPYFEEQFKEDPDLLEEIANMKSNQDDKLEYYSSFFYLKFLLNRRS